MQNLPADRQKKLPASGGSGRAARKSLAAAFASFNQTAGALESTYTKLQAEVGRLRHELENKNRSLAESLEENRHMRTYLGRILEGLPCGVLVFENSGKLRMINPAAQRLLTVSLGSLAPEATVPPMLSALLQALPKEDFHYEQEWTVEGAEGERTIGVTRAVPATQGSGDDSIVILRDVTEAKQLEGEREAARRTQALAEMATLLAHEIRNPLGSLELFAGLLADALGDDAEMQAWVNHVQAGLRSLAATVNNVLHFHSQPPANLLPLNLVRVVEETVEFLRPLARQRGMRIDLRTGEGAIPVLADPPRLQQAFFNLALNAFRAMKPGGTLRVGVFRRAEDSGPAATVTFTDCGEGISTENLEKVFAPGFTTHPGSPGIGLAVTRKVVEQHRGTIRVESREAQGTTFTLVFPVQGVEA
jgi:signal transduction histidine kinase